MKKPYTFFRVILFLALLAIPNLSFANGEPGTNPPNGSPEVQGLLDSKLGHCVPVIVPVANCATGTVELFAFISYTFTGILDPYVATWSTGQVAHKITVVPPGTWSWDYSGAGCDHPLIPYTADGSVFSPPGIASLISPANGTTGLGTTTQLTWTAVADASTYSVQVATNPSFSAGSIVWSQTVSGTTATVSGLQVDKVYYWRIRASNACGSGDYSSTFAFQTGQILCDVGPFVTTYIEIDPLTVNTVQLSREMPLDRIITDVNVYFHIGHVWVGDLSASLVSPYNDVIPLFDRPGVPMSQYGCDGDDATLTFDNLGSNASLLENQCNNPPPALSGTFKPLGSLTILNGKRSKGYWTLSVTDNEIGDGGGLTEFGLEFCLDARIPAGSILTNVPLTVSSGGSGTIDITKLRMETTGTLGQGVFTLLSLPQHGTLFLNNTPLSLGGTFTQANINNGVLVYTNNGDGATTDNFHFDALDQNNDFWVHDAIFNINIISGNVLITTVGNAEDLIKEVFVGSNCFDVTNVTYSGQSDQIGQFSNGLGNVGFDSGIILATGGISVAPGPNDSDGASAGYGISTPDADLSSLTTGAPFDMANIEFDFTPTQSPFTFEFVFASEEYCDYVNTQFNDVIGFFISGPGIIGTQNLAVVPSTNTPININTINHLVNTGYYIHNTPASGNNCSTIAPASGPAVGELQYDGFTHKMVAVANVIPCQTYHIKLKIADVGDGVWDSAVFLKAGSFDGGGNASIDWLVNGEPDVDEVTEGCGTVELLIDRVGSNSALPIPVTFTITGTAASGTDYSPISTTYIIPAGQDQLLVPVNIINDLIPEGAETVVLTLNNACSCLNPQEILTILDYNALMPIADTVAICGPGLATVGVTVEGGVAPYSYQWNIGATGQSITPFVGSPTTYTVTITDACGKTSTAQARVNINQPPQAQLLGPGPQICPGQTAMLMINFTGTGPFDISYNFNGNPQPGITGITNDPYALVVNNAGVYTLASVIDGAGCPGVVSGTVIVTSSSLSLTGITSNASCTNLANGAINTTVTGGQGPYTYAWTGPSNIGNIPDPTGLLTGTYSVTVTDVFGCTHSQVFSIGAPTAITVSTIINGNVITVLASGGTGFLQYSIDGINFQAGNQFTNLPCGTYTVTVGDANGCTVTSQATVNVLSGSFQTPAAILCFGGSTTITMIASCGVPPYQYKLGNGPFQGGSIFSSVNAGTYSGTILDASGSTIVLGPIVIDQPPQLSVTASLICNDATLAFSGGTPPYTFASDAPNPDLQNLPNGSYHVTATDGNGCTKTTTFSVNVPPLGVSFATDSVLCFGGNTGSIVATGIGGCLPYTYSLGGSPFLLANSFPNLAAGTYSLAVKDAKGNLSSVFVTVFQPALLGLSATVNGSTITANATAGTSPYSYSLNGGTPQSDGAFSNLAPGIYTVVTTDANGCTASVTNLVSGTVEPSEAWGMVISPNPSEGLFVLTLQNAPDVLHAEVFDVTGRLLQSLDLNSIAGKLTTTFDLQDLPQGTYLLRLSDGKNWGGVRLSKVGGQ